MALVVISKFANKSIGIQMYYGTYFCIFYFESILITLSLCLSLSLSVSLSVPLSHPRPPSLPPIG